MSNSKDKPFEGEVVTSAQLDRILGKSHEADMPAMDALLDRLEQLFKESAKIVDIDSPEGWFGELFGGVDYRIAVKTDRGRAIAGLIDTFMNQLDQFEGVEQKIRAINRAQYDRHIDRIRAARTALEEQQKLEAVVADARLQQQLEKARVEAEIEKYKKQVRDAQQPSPPPAPSKADEFEAKRQASRQEKKLECELKLDSIEAEADFQDRLSRSALARILKIFAEPEARRAQKRCRILNLRDNYGIDDSLLPAGVLELLQEED